MHHVSEFKLGDTSNLKPLKAPEPLVLKLHKRVGLELPANKHEYVRRRLEEEYN